VTEAALLAGMPHLGCVDLDSHGYSIVDLDRERLRFEWWTIDGLTERTQGTSLGMSMTVRHGKPRLVADDPVPNSTAMSQPNVRS
jgi:alkaline phosphatase D